MKREGGPLMFCVKGVRESLHGRLPWPQAAPPGARAGGQVVRSSR